MSAKRASCRPVSPDQSDRFRRLCWHHLPDLLRVAWLLTHRQHTAEDLVQETMLKALRAIDSFEEGTDVKAWLMTILRRTHIDIVRNSPLHGRLVYLAEGPQLDRSSPCQVFTHIHERSTNYDDDLEQFEDREVVTALRALPEAIRWTLLLVDVEEMSHSEAALVLGVPVGTIKSRAHRGYAKLRDQLRRCAQRYQLVA